MNFKKVRNRLRYILQFIPFTKNALLFGIIITLCFRFLKPSVNKEDLAANAQYPLIHLMGTFIIWFFIALILLSILSALATWFYFYWLSKKGASSFQVDFKSEEVHKRKRHYFEARMPKVLRPILGFVKGRLFYDNYQLTAKFSLLSAQHKKNSLLRQAIYGKSRIQLPDIKEYQIVGGIVFFEDMLQIVSLPLLQNTKAFFYQSPKIFEENLETLAPKKTDAMDIRIEEMRKVEGDFLNYKDFESGDDVRRIVWKVFAKNRDLVVRIPERMEPFASHLYFYASFYNSFPQFLNNQYFAEMLNHYKSNVWSIYQQLTQQNWQLKFIPDQEFHLGNQEKYAAKDERIISNCNWQKDNPLTTYCAVQKATVLLVSSVSDPKEVEKIISESDNSLKIIFVKLSPIFRQYVALHWLKNIFFVPPKDRLSMLKSKWIFSPLRRQILKNEKKIEKLLA